MSSDLSGENTNADDSKGKTIGTLTLRHLFILIKLTKGHNDNLHVNKNRLNTSIAVNKT